MGKRKQEAEGEEQSHLGLGSELGSVLGSDFSSTSYSAGTGSVSRNVVERSNIGFQLLKKCGWKEGTGLGAAEQGRLDPIETHVKHDKRGIGAEKKPKPVINLVLREAEQKQAKTTQRKLKTLSKRLRKLQAEEKRMQEQEFERAFFREFFPDNV